MFRRRSHGEDIGSETVGAVHEEGEMVGGMPRRVQHLDLKARRPDHLPIHESLDRRHQAGEVGGVAVREDRSVQAFVHRDVDVILVVVGEQDRGDVDPLSLDALQQRLAHPVPVDQDALASCRVDDQVCVRQPDRVLGAMNLESSGHVLFPKAMTLRMPSWAAISSKPVLTSGSVIRCEMKASTSISPARYRSTSSGT